MLIVKIGGAVITDKSVGAVNQAKFDELERVAKTLAENLEDELILVHGVGSFGHPHVLKYELNEKKNVDGVVATHLSCVSLNVMFCGYLHKFGLRPVPLHPLTAFRMEGGRLRFDSELIGSLAEEGLIPVIHGDMVYDVAERTFKVLSGDKIAVELAKVLKPKALGFATDVEGVIVGGKVVRELSREEFDALEGGKADVTGGMAGKVRCILDAGVEARIFHAKDLDRFLKGEEVGTLVRG